MFSTSTELAGSQGKAECARRVLVRQEGYGPYLDGVRPAWRAALEKEHQRLKRVDTEARKMIPPDADAAMVAWITRRGAEILGRRMEECERKAREYKP